MTSQYYIKLYFSKPGQAEPEIRRFAIDTSAERDAYRDMIEKITALYTEEQVQGLTLQYIDDEDERVTFSSNEELRAAIECNQGSNHLKVFAVTNSVTQRAEQQGSAMNNTLPEELRFETAAASHPHQRTSKTHGTSSSTNTHSGPHSPLTPPPHHYHHHFHAHKAQHRRHLPPSFVPPTEFFEHVQSQIPRWLPTRAQTAHVSNHIKDHIENLKANTQSYMQNSKEYLENVGQYLQQALSPLGIDCDYRVDGQPPSTTTTTTKTETSSSSQTTANENEATSMETSNEKEASSAATGSSSTATVSSKNEYEEAIEDCLKRLKAMGFNDPNGALTDLVRSKQGNINSVLDAINPRQN